MGPGDLPEDGRWRRRFGARDDGPMMCCAVPVELLSGAVVCGERCCRARQRNPERERQRDQCSHGSPRRSEMLGPSAALKCFGASPRMTVLPLNLVFNVNSLPGLCLRRSQGRRQILAVRRRYRWRTAGKAKIVRSLWRRPERAAKAATGYVDATPLHAIVGIAASSTSSSRDRRTAGRVPEYPGSCPGGSLLAASASDWKCFGSRFDSRRNAASPSVIEQSSARIRRIARSAFRPLVTRNFSRSPSRS